MCDARAGIPTAPLRPPQPHADLPPVSALRRARALWSGPLLLCLTGLTGAFLVHLIEHHLGIGSRQPLRQAAFMLAHCPLGPELLAIVLVSLSAIMGLANTLRLLTRKKQVLDQTAAGLSARVILKTEPEPRLLRRLLLLFGMVLVVQLLSYVSLDHVWSLGRLMYMHGVLVQMAPPGALPAAPLHLAVAAALATVVWWFERRLRVLEEAIDALRRVLAALVPPVRRQSPLADQYGLPRRPFGSPSGLPRPPPRRLIA